MRINRIPAGLPTLGAMSDAITRSPSALWSLLDDSSRERISLEELLAVFNDRAMPALVLLFAAPNAAPMPPGMSAVLGVPLLLLCVQWWCGIGPWLPAWLLRTSVPRRDLAMWMKRGLPWLQHAPARMAVLVSKPCERMAGALASLLALVVLLPIPLGNMPPALAISVLALGFMRRDGAWVLGGVALGVAALAIASGVVWGAAQVLARIATSL